MTVSIFFQKTEKKNKKKLNLSNFENFGCSGRIVEKENLIGGTIVTLKRNIQIFFHLLTRIFTIRKCTKY